MDDYNVSVLSEAKNEYSSRLVTILSPLIIEGIKSIFNEAVVLCNENDEEEKYLMTFQNFLSRVPKWNNSIVDEETERIIKKSGCSYLEDLLTCVHITQLKILTSIRVSSKQKKIDISIPKLGTFIHKVYSYFARKIYKTVYLFDTSAAPLTYQKHMRECDILCKESILEVIRDNMPVESILRAYMDETIEEDIIEETVEEIVDKPEEEKKQETKTISTDSKDDISVTKKSGGSNEDNDDNNDTGENIKIETPTLKTNDELISEDKEKPMNERIATQIENFKEKITGDLTTDDVATLNTSDKPKLSFNDKDSVLDMQTNKESLVEAPKSLDRLEQISKERNEQRKLDEAEFEDDDDEPLKIMGDVNLNDLGIENFGDSKKKDTKDDIVLDIEEL